VAWLSSAPELVAFWLNTLRVDEVLRAMDPMNRPLVLQPQFVTAEASAERSHHCRYSPTWCPAHAAAGHAPGGPPKTSWESSGARPHEWHQCAVTTTVASSGRSREEDPT
jgi:hypothetical protein